MESIYEIRAKEIMQDRRFLRDEREYMRRIYMRMQFLEDKCTKRPLDHSARAELAALRWVDKVLFLGDPTMSLRDVLTKIHREHVLKENIEKAHKEALEENQKRMEG